MFSVEKYLDASLTASERAEDLLSKMTVEEKVGQLNQRLYGFRIYERKGNSFELTEEFCKEVERFGGLGTLYGLYRADPWADKDEETGITPELAKEAYNTVQRYVIENSRLGIPMLLSTECPHGHQALGGGLLPVNLACGASFDPELLKECYAACGKQLAGSKVDLALMSVLDVLRDPRWGRSEECYSEDPYLSSKMAFAAVTGMQSEGVGCISKHLCAQGETTGGINASAARIGERELREIHLPPVKAACEAGTVGVMAAYNEIDGIYCHANSWLLRKVLRGEFGFSGVVMADGVALDALDKVTNDNVKSGALAMHASVDISLWDSAYTKLGEALEKGYITMEELDEAVLRVLKLKFERGLFEHPYMENDVASAKEYGIPEVSLQMARESIVVLKNEEQLLPLTEKYQKILVVGPNADELYRQLGDYTPPVKREEGSTVLDGIRLTAGNAEVTYLPACGLFHGTSEELEAVAEQAKEYDVVIAVIGGSSSRFESVTFDTNGAALLESGVSMDCGEGRDVADVELPAIQKQLIDVLVKTGKPVVTVVVAGRPYGMKFIAEQSNALLQVFYPGPQGGQAVGEVLFGITEPSGRLPVSIPETSGNIPVYYNCKGSYRVQNYLDHPDGVLFPFGAGLSYTTFSYENCKLSFEGDKVRLEMTIKNTGDRKGTAVPQLYIHHKSGSVVPRIKELKWFKRVNLEVGEEVTISELLDKDIFAVWNIEMKYVVESGETEWFFMDMGNVVAKGIIIK